MTSREKRLARLRRSPDAVRFADLRSALEAAGFVGRPGKGDHWVFVHQGLQRQVVVDPRRPHVLRVYVKAALAAIDEVSKDEAGT